MDIYSILASKPHNPHYLNRYITFIAQCRQKNIGYGGYTEEHHICPKANDMFPEYENFRQYSWNRAVLTARQHFIAHTILWKAYPSIKSNCESLWCISHMKKQKVSSRLYEKLRVEIILRRKDTIPVIDTSNNKDVVFRVNREHPLFKDGTYIHNTKNKVVVKDINGNVFQTDINDSRYISGELVGHTKGMRVVKDEFGNKFMSSDIKYQSFHKDMVSVKLSDGSIKKISKNEYLSGNFEGQFKDTIQVRDKNGNYFRVHKTDQRYISGELVGSQKGKITITDGKSNKRIFAHETIPEGYERGSCKAKRYKKAI